MLASAIGTPTVSTASEMLSRLFILFKEIISNAPEPSSFNDTLNTCLSFSDSTPTNILSLFIPKKESFLFFVTAGFTASFSLTLLVSVFAGLLSLVVGFLDSTDMFISVGFTLDRLVLKLDEISFMRSDISSSFNTPFESFIFLVIEL